MKRRSLPIPMLGADPQEISQYAKRVINFDSSYRNIRLNKPAQNLYYYLDEQWLKQSDQLMGNSSVGFAFAAMENEDDLPQPTTNIIAPACDNEIARVGGKEYRFLVTATEGKPVIRRAAKLGTDILQYTCKRLDWDQKRNESIMWDVITGTVGMRAGWDRKLTDTMLVASPDACTCPRCGGVYTSPSAPATERPNLALFDGEFEMGEEEVSFSMCPRCQEPTPLVPQSLTPEQAKGEDSFGRPLGYSIPKGEPTIDVLSPFQLFPMNAGAVFDRHMRRHASARVVPIEWCEERYDIDVTPSNIEDLKRVMPFMGNFDSLGYTNQVSDQDLLEDHVLLKEICIEPYVEEITSDTLALAEEAGIQLPGTEGTKFLNKGRYYLLAGEDVLEEGPLHIDVKDSEGKPQSIQRVHYEYAVYKQRLSEFWGDGLPNSGTSIQNRINMIDALWLDAFHRMGSPGIMVPDQMTLTGPAWNEELGCRVRSYAAVPGLPGVKPEVMEGTMLPAEAWHARGIWMEDGKNILNLTDVELGGSPPGVRNTSQLFLMGEQSKTRRQPREFGLVQMFKGTLKHTLKFLYFLRTEEDTYEVDAKGAGSTEIRYFKGTDLLGQYNVDLDKSAGVDQNIYTSEAAAEAMQQGVYDLSDPVARDRYLDFRKLPKINENENQQIANAQNIGVNFAQKRQIHNPDLGIEDPWVCYEILGEFWLKDDAIQDYKAQMFWNEQVSPQIEGWEDRLAKVEQMDQLARQYYADPTGNITPELAQMKYQQVMPVFQQQQAEFQNQQAQFQQATQAGQAMPAPMAPPQPPEPLILPQSLKYKIMYVFKQMLQMGENPTNPGPGVAVPPEVDELMALLDFYALIQAYKLASERKKMAAMMGPQLASPGSAATPAGLEPTSGTPVNSAPGTTASPSNLGVQMPTGPLH